MELHVTLAVISAALFHASWNSLIKGGTDKLLDSVLLSSVWVIAFVIICPFLPLPDPSSWPYMAVSVIVHVGYLFLLAQCYQTGELSRVYPIMRGLPPLIVSVLSFLVLNEPMSLKGWLGVATISMGILALEIGHKTPSKRVLLMSILTACCISTYTVLDGIGARLSGHSTSFVLWHGMIHSVIFGVIVSFMRSKQQCWEHMRRHWQRGIVGGVLSVVGYAIVIWAVTQAPIAYVSALRETSVLFASIIAILFLSEPMRVSRIASAVLIVVGVAIMKMG